MKHVSSILVVTFLLATTPALAMSNMPTNSAAATTPSYSQGYEDGFLYTAQQAGKGCKNRLSQRAVERLDKSIRVKKASGDSGGDSFDGDGNEDGDDGVDRSFADYNQGKMQGMGDAMSAPANTGDLCTNGD